MKVKAKTTVTVNNKKYKPGDVFKADEKDVKSFIGAGYVQVIEEKKPEPYKEESKPKKGKGKK